MRYLRRIEHGIELDEIRCEIAANESAWLLDTSRQRRIRCQRDTQTVLLRIAQRPFPAGAHRNDVRASARTEVSYRFQRLYRWVEALAERMGGELGRVFLVRLKPGGRIYPHTDSGSYYASRDRYHLVVDSAAPSLLVCGGERAHVQANELWWLANKQEYAEHNDSDQWRVHVIVDLLLTPLPRPGAEDRHFHRVDCGVDVAPLVRELERQPECWTSDTSRQRNVRVQRETESVILRAASRPLPPGVALNDAHDSAPTRAWTRFPMVAARLDSMARELGGRLGRALLVRLPPGARVHRHVDEGEYYRARDRYHLVLKSPGGSTMTSGDQCVEFREGELWWFDNKAPHAASNGGDSARIHLIFDLWPDRKALHESGDADSGAAQHQAGGSPGDAANEAGDVVIAQQLEQFVLELLRSEDAVAPALLAAELRAKTPVWLGLRSQGELVAESWRDGCERATSLRAAFAECRRCIVPAVWQRIDTAQLALTHDFCSLSDHHDLDAIDRPVDRGMFGIALEIDGEPGSLRRIPPFAFATGGGTIRDAVAAYRQEHGLSGGGSEIRSVRVRSFRADQYLVRT